MQQIWVLNGPNLNRLGMREPEIYGTQSLKDLQGLLEPVAASLKMSIDMRQTNSESELIGWLHEAADHKIPVVLNPGAFTHYSYALRDAIAMRTAPVIEVHISNPAAREEFRHTSVTAGAATGTIAGFGFTSYLLALHAIAAS
jgi:3-dehydroquinate dehydratase II